MAPTGGLRRAPGDESIPAFACELVEKDPAPIVRVEGELDGFTAPELWSVLEPVCDERPVTLVLDVADLRHVDSAGITVIVRALNRVRQSDGRILIRWPRTQVRATLELTGLDHVLDVEHHPHP